MLIKEFTDLSAVSSETYTYTDPIDLNKKWLDQHQLYIKVDIQSAVSGTLYLVMQGAESNASGTTFVSIPNIYTGTSVVLSGVSINLGQDANGTYLAPLSIAAYNVSDFLKPLPFIKFGYRAFQDSVDFKLTLIGS